MEEHTIDALGEWESEGGAPANSEAGASLPQLATAAPTALIGTPNQIDWAVEIKERVGKDFDRVANALKSVAARQVAADRLDTEKLIAILNELRAEVMARDQAGYFIHDWQDPGDQVRQMIVKDPRYDAINAARTARKRHTKLNPH